MSKIGKLLGLVSPVLAIGVVALVLFGSSYSYQSGSCRSTYGHQSSESEECTYESSTISAFRYALEEGDRAVFFWPAFVVVVSIVGAMGALANRVGWVWVSAVVLWALTALSMMSIGLFVAPLAIVMFAAAALITVSRAEPE